MLSDDLYRASGPDDIVSIHTDPATNYYAKTQPQKWKDGKDIEQRINAQADDANFKADVATKAGLPNLNGYSMQKQVQVKLPDGTYFVADNVWYKQVSANNYEIIINETKLSNAAPFTQRQNTFLQELTNGNTNFELRSKKFGQGANLLGLVFWRM